MFERSFSNLLIWLVYAGLVAGLTGTLVIARQRVLASPTSESEQVEWEQWRHEAARQESGEGPVSRRIPKATEPPTRVLLRDHFATSLITLIVLSSALYFAVAGMLRGVVAGPRFQPDLTPD